MKKRYAVYAALIGFVNALFGAGGGMICVPLLKKSGLDQKRAQATTISIILPLTIVTAAIYLFKGYVSFSDALPFVIPGFFGATLGCTVFKKLSSSLLCKIFALFMLWAGIRMTTK